jgi:hypothetical protein
VALQSGKLAAKLEAIRQVQSLAATNPKMRGAYRLWQKYEGEIESLVNQQAAANHIFPQTWINAFTYVKGLHAEELVEGAVSGGENFFSEPVTGGGAPENGRGGEKKDELSPREMDIARKMKITPERYLEQKKKMTVVSET